MKRTLHLVGLIDARSKKKPAGYTEMILLELYTITYTTVYVLPVFLDSKAKGAEFL
jgi:hypothetical protein